MRRREFLKYTAAMALAGSLAAPAVKAQDLTIKVGVVGAKTGPLAPGAAVTHFPPYQLWAYEVNELGVSSLRRPAQSRVDRVRRPYPATRDHQGRGASGDGGQGRLDRRRVRNRL